MQCKPVNIMSHCIETATLIKLSFFTMCLICSGIETNGTFINTDYFQDTAYIAINHCANIRILSLDALCIKKPKIIMQCSDCPNLETIVESDKITELHIERCPKIKKIPQLKNLKSLDCHQCPSLTTIPLIKGLVDATFVDCRSLISIPQNSKVHSHGIKSLRYLRVIDCHWSSIQKSESVMSDQIQKLITLQQWFRKQILGRRLTRLIPWIMPLYYHPAELAHQKEGTLKRKQCLNSLILFKIMHTHVRLGTMTCIVFDKLFDQT